MFVNTGTDHFQGEDAGLLNGELCSLFTGSLFLAGCLVAPEAIGQNEKQQLSHKPTQMLTFSPSSQAPSLPHLQSVVVSRWRPC